MGDRLGADFPVYVVLSKSDAIAYFRECFRRLNSSEEAQVLGSSVQPLTPASHSASEIYAQSESRRLTEAFNQLYCTLAEHRLTFLSRETDVRTKPAVYEFPRELKRLRSVLIDWLVAIFRAHPLQPGPVLRGFYFTGVRQVPAGTDSGRMPGVGQASGPARAPRLLRAGEPRQQM